MDKYLIKNTTKEQREEIVRKSLEYCEIGCDDYFDGYEMYEPYINGEKEISEITNEYKARYVSGESSMNYGRGMCNR